MLWPAIRYIFGVETHLKWWTCSNTTSANTVEAGSTWVMVQSTAPASGVQGALDISKLKTPMLSQVYRKCSGSAAAFPLASMLLPPAIFAYTSSMDLLFSSCHI